MASLGRTRAARRGAAARWVDEDETGLLEPVGGHRVARGRRRPLGDWPERPRSHLLDRVSPRPRSTAVLQHAPVLDDVKRRNVTGAALQRRGRPHARCRSLLMPRRSVMVTSLEVVGFPVGSPAS